MARKIERITREELLKYVREELICTIGSADSPITINVLITTFRDDTFEDIDQLAYKLGYPSIEALLHSKEVADIVEPCYTDLAKGAGNEKPKKVYCYRVKPTPMIEHILSSIEEANIYKKNKEEKLRRMEVLFGDPKNNPKILEGKERLVYLIHGLGGSKDFVNLLDLQLAYKEFHEAELNKMQLKEFFPTGQLKGIMDRYLYQDVELATDKNKNGSLLFRLKRPYEDICAEIRQILEEHQKIMKEEEERKKKTEEKKEKKVKGPSQQPKKLRVINPPPPPKPKPIPKIETMVRQTNEYYTDNRLLYQKIALAQKHCESDGEEEEHGSTEETKDEETPNSNAMKYTTRLQGATYTDDEDESEGEDDGEEEDDYGDWELEETISQENERELMNNPNQAGISSNSKTAKLCNDRTTHNQQNKADKENEEKFEEKAVKRLQMAKKKNKEQKAFMDQVIRRNEICGAVEGVFNETKRFGRRAKEEALRRDRVAKLLEKLEPKMGKPFIINEQMSENSKKRIVALIVGMIWTNRELGISEIRNMLKLMFGCDVQLDVERFVAANCKCVKTVRAPIEPHLVIMEAYPKQIAEQIATNGKQARQQASKKQ